MDYSLFREDWLNEFNDKHGMTNKEFMIRQYEQGYYLGSRGFYISPPEIKYDEYKEEWLSALNENGMTNKEQITNDYITKGQYSVPYNQYVKSPINQHNEMYVNQNGPSTNGFTLWKNLHVDKK